MSKLPRIAVIYTHFPHYRAPVFNALSQSGAYEFKFYYDPAGIEKSILSGTAGENHTAIATRKWRGLMWQAGAIKLALDSSIDGYIFLGNPFILSTWVAAWLARRRGKPVFLWTHGWQRREFGIKAWLRRRFYQLADGLMVYGLRARLLGEAMGFEPTKIHVINNSLDYPAQRHAREIALTRERPGGIVPVDKPFFLTVSRLIEGAALEQAIEALRILEADAVLVIVGDGPQRYALEAQSRRLGVDVRFLGAIYDEAKLAELFINTTAVVSPGKVGLLAMHALAYGAPVITHGDFDRQMPEAEAIQDGHTGAFFRYGDVSDLARKMSMFLGIDSSVRHRARNSAIARIECDYTPQVQVSLITAALDANLRRGTS